MQTSTVGLSASLPLHPRPSCRVDRRGRHEPCSAETDVITAAWDPSRPHVWSAVSGMSNMTV